MNNELKNDSAASMRNRLKKTSQAWVSDSLTAIVTLTPDVAREAVRNDMLASLLPA